jgi:hypothetical protein
MAERATWKQRLGGGQVFKTWEAKTAQVMDRLARSEVFLSKVGKALERSFVFKTQMDRLVEQSLRNMRLASLSELESVHKRIDEVDRRLDAIHTKLDTLLSQREA